MEFRGELKADAVWAGEVRLTGDVVVPAGRVLRLQGARLSFEPVPKWSCSVFRAAPEGYPIEATCRQACDLVVFGRLEAEGARLCGPERGSWGGLTLLGSGRASLRDCELSGAGESAVQCFDDSRLTVAGGEVSRCRVGVLGWGLSRIDARDAFFHDCDSAVLCREGSFARLEGCRLARVSEAAWSQQWSVIEASQCRFEDCSNFRAGAYEHSRVVVDGRLVEREEKLR